MRMRGPLYLICNSTTIEHYFIMEHPQDSLWQYWTFAASRELPITVKHQNRRKSLVRLRICLPEPIKKNKNKKTSSGIRTQVVWLTDREFNHSYTGVRSHRTDCTQTHIHTCTSFMEGQEDGGDSRGFSHFCGRRRVSWLTAILSSYSLGTRQV